MASRPSRVAVNCNSRCKRSECSLSSISRSVDPIILRGTQNRNSARPRCKSRGLRWVCSPHQWHWRSLAAQGLRLSHPILGNSRREQQLSSNHHACPNQNSHWHVYSVHLAVNISPRYNSKLFEIIGPSRYTARTSWRGSCGEVILRQQGKGVALQLSHEM